MNKKILFFSYWYPNKSNTNFAIYVKRHAASIKINNEIVVLSFNIIKGSSIFKKHISVFSDEHNIEIHQIYLESKFNKLLYFLLPFHFFIIKKYIKNNIKPNFKFNFIHSNILFPCAIVGNWLSDEFKCHHIITEHWSKIDRFFRTNIFKYSARKALDKAFAITCVSQLLAETIKTYTKNDHVLIIPNVIDSSQFYFDPKIEKNKTLTFIAVAHWEAPKNPFYFLDALETLKLEGKLEKFKVVLVGTGNQLTIIKNKKYNYEIEYKGNLSPSQLNNELNKSHVFLHGSDYETFSVIMAEAIMCGLPSVVSPVGIAKEIININSGYTTNNTHIDWKEKISMCIQTKYDNLTISKQLSEKYNQTTIGNLFHNLYNRKTDFN